jgi:hypothetical protein
MNANTGGLIAWLLLILWVHWFLPLPAWWASTKKALGFKPVAP